MTDETQAPYDPGQPGPPREAVEEAPMTEHEIDIELVCIDKCVKQIEELPSRGQKMRVAQYIGMRFFREYGDDRPRHVEEDGDLDNDD